MLFSASGRISCVDVFMLPVIVSESTFIHSSWFCGFFLRVCHSDLLKLYFSEGKSFSSTVYCVPSGTFTMRIDSDSRIFSNIFPDSPIIPLATYPVIVPPLSFCALYWTPLYSYPFSFWTAPWGMSFALTYILYPSAPLPSVPFSVYTGLFSWSCRMISKLYCSSLL